MTAEPITTSTDSAAGASTATRARARLEAIFATVLDLPADHPFETLEYRGIEAWSSVGHMVLVGEIEDAFDVMLETEDVVDMSSFTKAQEILARHGVDFDV